MSDEDLLDLEEHACPGAGACGGQFTANTMAMILEFLGLSPMGSAGPPALDGRKDEVCARAGRLVMELLERGLTPERILTREAFENGIAAGAATGGSTNLVLHLLAIAREVGVPLDIDDFDPVSNRTPIIADLKPGGRYTAVDVDRAGGSPLLGKRLLDAGLIDGNQLTTTGRTLAEEVEGAEETPGTGRYRTCRRTAEAFGWARDPQGQPRAGGLRGQGRGLHPPGAYGPCPRLRLRGGRHERRAGRRDHR